MNPEKSRLWKLQISQGDGAGQTFPLKEHTRLGREPDYEIALEDEQISRFHAVIKKQEDGFVITDQNSTNGIFVNGERIDSPTKLHQGDKIKVGETHFLVKRETITPATIIGMPPPKVEPPPKIAQPIAPSAPPPIKSSPKIFPPTPPPSQVKSSPKIAQPKPSSSPPKKKGKGKIVLVSIILFVLGCICVFTLALGGYFYYTNQSSAKKQDVQTANNEGAAEVLENATNTPLPSLPSPAPTLIPLTHDKLCELLPADGRIGKAVDTDTYFICAKHFDISENAAEGSILVLATYAINTTNKSAEERCNQQASIVDDDTYGYDLIEKTDIGNCAFVVSDTRIGGWAITFLLDRFRINIRVTEEYPANESSMLDIARKTEKNIQNHLAENASNAQPTKEAVSTTPTQEESEGKAPSVVGSWTIHNDSSQGASENYWAPIIFKEDGTIEYRNVQNKLILGIWEQNGNKISFSLAGYSSLTGTISGKDMVGEGHNKDGDSWTWQAIRDK